ncbi:MAG: quinate 5-dehydrogenase [Bacillota bacterium]|jgi:hypothetical protein|nr:quinate 5-dehydrogenase [Bacillota bacterium]MDD3298071.1 quinate 5-dehydrogenase [Bacillota bacterium]MDD3851036.1 quinate 5-dehydrogenase [Bacillota bacterium]MDD4707874.1 quinate 5-dehydrogenase [Bacillota bacterium]
MKRVLSVSIGSSTRDHRVKTCIMGQEFVIERRGTDGNIKKAIELIKENDGKVDAFGMGGIDLYICGGNRRYIIKDALPLKNAAATTPIVDGTGLKNTLERNVIKYISENRVINLEGKKVLVVSAMDRFGMAEAFQEAGAKVACGDLIFALGIPKQLNSLRALHRIARVAAPIACRLPFEMLYPTGKSQEVSRDRFEAFYQHADIIAGDYLYIKRYLPRLLIDKVIITNTITSGDIRHLAEIGVITLITTTPEYNGRSFGTNVMEAIIVAQAGKGKEELTPEEYNHYLECMDIKPRIEYLNTKAVAGGKD